MTLIEWFRNKFIPNCSDLTITALIFLFNKYNDELINNKEAQKYIKELYEEYSKPMGENIEEENKC